MSMPEAQAAISTSASSDESLDLGAVGIIEDEQGYWVEVTRDKRRIPVQKIYDVSSYHSDIVCRDKNTGDVSVGNMTIYSDADVIT